MYYVIFDEGNVVAGMYDNIEYVIEKYVTIDDELYNYICNIPGRCSFDISIPKEIYTIEDKDKITLLEDIPIIEETMDEKVTRLEQENYQLKNQNMIQDELINVSMMATDEMFSMFEPLLSSQPVVTAINTSTTTTRRKRSIMEVKRPMVDLYVAMVMRGLKTIDEVPVRYREQVKSILSQLEA